ncbi:MAG: BrnT family toxin [Treponema sp.]|nr:BrnT family toxin [Treponema sp.]
MEFEWDDKKEYTNFKKHGVSFDDAILIFNDPERIERYDETHTDNEDRWQTIGAVGEILFLVYVERKNNIRIISARFANSKERRLYYGDYKTNFDGWYKADT